MQIKLPLSIVHQAVLAVLSFIVILVLLSCHGDQEPEPVPNNKILLLKLDEQTNVLGIKEFTFYEGKEHFTPKIVLSEDYVNIWYKERNALLFKAILSRSEQHSIIVPEDFTEGSSLELIKDDDLILYLDTYSELNGYKVTDEIFKRLRYTISTLNIVQQYIKQNPTQPVYIYYYFDPNTRLGNWIIILNN